MNLEGLRLRFAERVLRIPFVECWLWDGYIDSNGYGKATAVEPGQSDWAHRVAYILFVGAIPAGLTIDHLCRVRACVRPDHLEAVPIRENILRGNGWAGRHARQTHCLRGHEFTPENTYIVQRPGVVSGRECRRCHADREAARRAPFARRGRICKNGHVLTPETIRYRERQCRGALIVVRECRPCRAAARARYAAKRRVPNPMSRQDRGRLSAVARQAKRLMDALSSQEVPHVSA